MGAFSNHASREINCPEECLIILLLISEYSTVKHWSVVCVRNLHIFVLEKPIKKSNKSPFDSHVEETELEGKKWLIWQNYKENTNS